MTLLYKIVCVQGPQAQATGRGLILKHQMGGVATYTRKLEQAMQQPAALLLRVLWSEGAWLQRLGMTASGADTAICVSCQAAVWFRLHMQWGASASVTGQTGVGPCSLHPVERLHTESYSPCILGSIDGRLTATGEQGIPHRMLATVMPADMQTRW